MEMSGSSEAWRMIRSYAVAGAHDSSVINRMMLRFRPIAPKPATCPDGSPRSRESPGSFGVRRKRKYVRVRRNRKKNDDVLRDDHDNKEESSTLLQLLPAVTETDLNLAVSTVSDDDVTKRDVTQAASRSEGCGSNSNRVLLVRSWVTVESVAGTSDHYNQSAAMDLASDTCPGFVSDGSDSVVWVNGAFKRMVAAKQRSTAIITEEEVEVVADLVIRERFPSFYSAFTGHVKLQYCACASGGRASEVYSRVVPCDVWRIDGGGFAWSLDVEAALTLGRN